jgi:hypothetical protein
MPSSIIGKHTLSFQQDSKGPERIQHGFHLFGNRGLSDGRSPSGCDTLPIIDVLEAQEKGDRL